MVWVNCFPFLGWIDWCGWTTTIQYDRPEPHPVGGVALFIKDSIPHSPCTALTPPHPLGIPLWLPLYSHLMFICVLYRPPNSDDSIYTSLSEKMDQLLSSHPNSLFLLCGDFNCHHASWLGVGTSQTCHGTLAKDFCDSLGMTQSVNFPTQISTNGTPSLLDLIFHKFPWKYLFFFSNWFIWPHAC